MFIYKIINLVNNKIYVGKTTSTIEKRFKSHKKSYKSWLKGNRGCSHLYSAFDKYGIENFIIEELDTASTIDELNEKEIYWIKKLDSINPDVGYNILTGGNGGWEYVNELNKNLTKDEKDRKNQKTSEFFKAIERTDEWCTNISKSLTGHNVSQTTRDKLHNSKSGKIACYNIVTNELKFMDIKDTLNLDENWILHKTGLKLNDEIINKLRKMKTGLKYSEEVNMSKGFSKYIFKIDNIESTNWHEIARYIEDVYNVIIPNRYILVKLCTTNTTFQYKKYSHLNFLIDKCSYKINKR